MLKIISSLILITVFVMFSMPAESLAQTPKPRVQCATGEQATDFGCVKIDQKDPNSFFSWAYGVGLGLIGAVGLMALVYGGFMILGSQGNPEKINIGKAYIFYAIIGMVMAFSGYLIYQAIGGRVLQIPGFG